MLISVSYIGTERSSTPVFFPGATKTGTAPFANEDLFTCTLGRPMVVLLEKTEVSRRNTE